MTWRQGRKGFDVGVAVDVDTAAAAVLAVAAVTAELPCCCIFISTLLEYRAVIKAPQRRR